MPDRKKVIKGLECLITNDVDCDGCPYNEGENSSCLRNIAKDALELLKEQEPVEQRKETLLLYRYGTLLRPAGPGAVPRDGLHAIEEGIVTPYGKPFWSLVDYERRLTNEEIKQYELEFIGRVEVKR